MWFLKEARGYPIPSPAALSKVSKAYVEAIDRFACENEIPMVLSCLCAYAHLFNGLTNRSLRALVVGLILGYSARQMTYDLRRLRRKGFIRPHPQEPAL